jgi:hypothetical protein
MGGKETVGEGTGRQKGECDQSTLYMSENNSEIH